MTDDVNRTNTGPQEIVDRLRERANHYRGHNLAGSILLGEAADEIEKLRAALKDILNIYRSPDYTNAQAQDRTADVAREALHGRQ